MEQLLSELLRDKAEDLLSKRFGKDVDEALLYLVVSDILTTRKLKRANIISKVRDLLDEAEF